MNIKIFIILALLVPGLAAAAGKDKEVKVVSVYDADTFRMNVWYWPAIIGKNMPVRVNGIDAPEIRGKCQAEKLKAQAAKRFTVKFLKGGKVKLKNIKRGKYFRIIADVEVNGQNLGFELIKAGHARPYTGGKRKGWCGK